MNKLTNILNEIQNFLDGYKFEENSQYNAICLSKELEELDDYGISYEEMLFIENKGKINLFIKLESVRAKLIEALKTVASSAKNFGPFSQPTKINAFFASKELKRAKQQIKKIEEMTVTGDLPLS